MFNKQSKQNISQNNKPKMNAQNKNNANNNNKPTNNKPVNNAQNKNNAQNNPKPANNKNKPANNAPKLANNAKNTVNKNGSVENTYIPEKRNKNIDNKIELAKKEFNNNEMGLFYNRIIQASTDQSNELYPLKHMKKT